MLQYIVRTNVTPLGSDLIHLMVSVSVWSARLL